MHFDTERTPCAPLAPRPATMTIGREIPAAPQLWTDWAGRPTWSRAAVCSLMLHVAVVLALAVSFGKPPTGGPWADNRTITVSLASEQDDSQYYADETSDETDTSAVEIAAEAADAAPGGGEASPFDDQPPVDPRGALPSAAEWTGPPGESRMAAVGAGGMLNGPRAKTTPSGGRARTSVFGVQGEGYKFAYVFDRSGSMGGSGHSALAAAKAELKASLEDLSETHQFQIIFYNENPTIFPIAGHIGRLVWGTPQNKRQALRFIDAITADGATRHEEALMAALKMGADVIFFLTDADQPELTPAQLDRIHRRNNGTTIHTIEFGLGPQVDRNNFLVKLARQNGGQHAYFDVSTLRAAR
jgi:hypothetical protein